MLHIQIDGLEDLLRRILREELDAHTAGGWLNSREAADYLGTTVGHLHNLVSEEKLPRHGAKGHGLRFTRADLDEYMLSRERR